MKITLFHTEFAYSGGAEKLIFKQMEYLQKKGFRVACFAAFVDRKNCFPEFINNFDIRQILPLFLNKFIPHDLMIILTTLAFPLWFFRLRNDDVFLGENQAGPWWAYLVSWIWGKPFLVYQNYPPTLVRPREIDKKAKRRTSLLAAVFLKLFKLLIVEFDHRVARRARVVLANGGYAKKVFEETYGREAINCPAGTERRILNRVIFQKRFGGVVLLGGREIKKPYLLITNRHFPAKRLDWGIKVISKIKTRKSKIRLVITGRPTAYTQELKRLVRKLKLEKNVAFTGLVSEQMLQKLYQNALVYFYTAPEEDFGMGVIEAMGHGVPVVAWNQAGPSYTVKNGQTGYLIKPGDLHDFVVKAERLLVNKKLCWQMAQAAYREGKNYSWEKHGKIIIQAIKKQFGNRNLEF